MNVVEKVETAMVDKLWNFLKTTGKILEERVFSPMYFYFIISRVLWNWKFVYVLLFVDQSNIMREKLDLMTSFYTFDSCWSFLLTLLHLLLALLHPLLWPLFTTWLAIQPLTWISNKITKYYEENQQVKRLEIHKLQFQEILLKAYEEKQQQEKEAEKLKIEYKRNSEFNEWVDQTFDPSGWEGIQIGEVTGFPISEALYYTDYEAYISLLENYKNDIKNDVSFLLQDDQKREEFKEILRDEIIQEWKDDQASFEAQERRKYQE